jgi:nucleoid DNA-binding protein
MDKPQSLSMREYLVRKLAPKLLLSEKIIDAVIVHQFTEANNALLSNNSVEISGFGKFVFNSNKAKKKLDRLTEKLAAYKGMLENNELTDARKQYINTVITTTSDSINSIKPKIDA